ncbi:hypothetical protein A2962_03830 [Candidatus Woesebacteria bacterium RIFCSPLOWO2_01_FULL_39_61]|uniref:Uncharacterized protein n=1 Tax=Candidatus Woesebacteria bacterium RIFCSPHIGHO2_02_FULL_39_13 TaxID=1802505 RepID=A0A1F7Z2P2_9BACT|nr:MAG: hypothetical protein A2692_02150 [Candidatus Woesebacteria bacterium RIFCSPHIGHO2_01_FULL_39_95]OGM33913.1 MAG: hypothetical protein A3D01_05835 [Candidatus Woesebacteria bacterium RIFCSPHIGHO2_02_FULL_39_13]OGM37202.1 MAG: hypothetical protein A3E13_03165 [Candidatus Woesebacteria bacterium RIFCSPHIGHO2_12_FULL_40_20]OGM65887.1 MAG: hypothetical protein A2962_03830 [Candidatus Woesebacteria bacterium RIFCSPLOWO2_01_FULL_39_61]OGM74070.1 MAG: hypothetical protein A3H19_02480 [Candidatus
MNKLILLLLALVLTLIPLEIFYQLVSTKPILPFFQIITLFLFGVITFLAVYVFLNKISNYVQLKKDTLIVKLLKTVFIIFGVLVLYFMFVGFLGVMLPAG